MAACRCSICSVDYPADEGMFAAACSRCIVCGERTNRFTNIESDPDWQEKAAGLLALRKDGELAELVPVTKANVRVESGQLWVLAWDIFKDVGRRKLKDGDLFRIGQQTFEVLDYVDERREYLVRTFSMTLSDEDLSRLAGP